MPGPAAGPCARCSKAAIGLSHQDSHAWCSQLVVWPQSYSTSALHPGQTRVPDLAAIPLLPLMSLLFSCLGSGGSITLGAEPKLGRKHRQKQARFSSLAWKTQSSPLAKGFPQLILEEDGRKWGLQGGKAAHGSRAEPLGFPSETRDSLELQSLALGFPEIGPRAERCLGAILCPVVLLF